MKRKQDGRAQQEDNNSDQNEEEESHQARPAKKPKPSFNPDEEVFDICDKDNVVIGREKRIEVHRKGLLHRAVHVLVYDEDKKKLLLQKRAEKKRINPSKWDLSVGEHLQPGEKDAAVRSDHVRVYL